MISFLKFVIPTSFIGKSYSFQFFRFVQTAIVPRIGDELTQYQAFSEQRAEINTCGTLYKEWKKEKKFWKIPDGDLKFTVRYIDTGKDYKVDDNAPIVLALHGAPGSYKDYDRMTSFLAQNGVRVIAPCFPDFSDYDPGIFRHSADEKAQYLKDFLQAININHFDLLVCHSSAVYPGLKLCVDNKNPTIFGLALFNPGAFDTSMRAIQPWRFVRKMISMSEFPIGFKVLKAIGPYLLKLVNIQVNVENYLDPLLSATVMVHAGIPESKEAYWNLSKRKFPIFMAFSENDKLISKELSYKIAYALGLQDNQIFHHDEFGHMDKEGKIHRNVKVMTFEKGSHYVFSKHSEVLNKEILKFLQENVL